MAIDQIQTSISPTKRFETSVVAAIEAFPSARLLQLVNAGRADMRHYHAILSTLFHQTYSGPYTFARAAVNCDWRHELAKEYLLRHAEEERTHWRWVLDDLSKRRVTPVRICATSRLIILLKRSLGCSTTLRRNDPLLG